VQMLLGSAVAALGAAEELRGELTLDEGRLRLRLWGHGIGPGALQLLFPPSPSSEDRGAVVMPLAVEGEVARLVAYRDFATLFEHRAELFPAEILPKFSRASTELAPILGGLDLGEDILGGLSGWIRAVSRPVEFDPAVRPEQPLPAVALMVDLVDPKGLGPQLISSFQTLIALLNVERGKQGQKPMLLFLEEHGGVAYSAARFLPPGPEDGVDIRYNLVPACALVGRTFLVGSHLHLVRELAEQLQAGQTTTERPGGDSLRLNSAALVDVLEANLDALVMDSVLDEGKSVDQAREEWNLLIGGIELFGGAEWSTRYLAPDAVEVGLALELAGSSQ